MKNERTTKKKIKDWIQRYFLAFNKGDQFYGVVLIDYIRDRLGVECYGDTILRYMRELRSDGIVKYKVVNRSKSIYVKL